MSTAVTASNLEMVNVLVLGNIDQTGVEAVSLTRTHRYWTNEANPTLASFNAD